MNGLKNGLKNDLSYRVNALGPLCLWQCFSKTLPLLTVFEKMGSLNLHWLGFLREKIVEFQFLGFFELFFSSFCYSFGILTIHRLMPY